MRDRIIIIGGGGHAKVIVSILKKLKERFEIVGYTDNEDRGSILGTTYLGSDDVLGPLCRQKKANNAVLGLGQVKEATTRQRIIAAVSGTGIQFPPIISPTAVINEDVLIGEGTVIMDGVVVNSGSRIGVFSILNTSASVDHDCAIGDYVHIAPGAVVCGGVTIGDFTTIGAGTSIIQYKSVSSHAVIGAGSVVLSDCPEPGTYAGRPARRISKE